MATSLDTRRIRRCTRTQLSDYFGTLSDSSQEDVHSQSILDAIERGSIKPITFATWLGVTKSSSAIQLGLRQSFSVIVRKSSIKHLYKALCSPKWKHTWDCLGGTLGLLNILSDLSVHEVRDTCRFIGRCGKGKDLSEKRKYITELFMGLQPLVFPDAPFTTTDRRPLTKYYRHLMPSCEELIVDRFLTGDLKNKWEPMRARYLMRYHAEVARREQLRALDNEPGFSINHARFNGLVNQFPKGRGAAPAFSASMEFSLTVLRRLVHDETAKLEHESFIDDLARPLLRRAVKKKAQWSRIQEIVDLIMQYLKQHPDVGKEISTDGSDVLYWVALCWTRKPRMFEKQLRALCSHPAFTPSLDNDLTDWENLLTGTPLNRRYALLRLCFYESTGLDIVKDEDLKRVKGSLSSQVLDRLNPAEALDLFIRLRIARGDENLVSIYFTKLMLDIPASFGGTGADPDLYHVTLLSRNDNREEARKLAVRCLEARKTKSVLASVPEQRAFHAKSALCYAAASGDLQLYQSVVEWTKRFLRDPLVLPQIYPRYYPIEVVKLLSGVPVAWKGSTASDVRTRVQRSNAIMQSMFDTAGAAIREPSFQTRDWEGILGLFQSVVQERIDMSEKLKKVLEASDDDMYSMFWENTIDMLLAVEEKANDSGLRKLQADSVRGPLGCVQQSNITLESKESSTYTFLDNLAKARDEFWQKLRPTVYPTVLTLPNPFPRGLPIQHLTAPYKINAQNMEELVPYLASRAKAVVFPDPTDALLNVPRSDDSKAAIGTFVDSYQHALELYIPASCNKDKREERISKAWNYAIGPLSQGRMNEDEAIRFWQGNGGRRPSAEPNFICDTWPFIPDVEDPTEPHEWNPFTAGRPDRPGRKLGTPSCLDLSLIVLNNTPYNTKLRSKLNYTELKVPARIESVDSIWNTTNCLGEGRALSALLYLEMMYGTSKGRLLGKPFPSAHDARYPNLYLDDEFQGDVLRPSSAVGFIRGHLDAVPPTLLHLSAQNMMGKLLASDQDKHGTNSDVQELALTMIMCLAECDQPTLAREMAVHAILDRPSASSWHRQLLHPTFFRRLPAAEARACFEGFADAILARMQKNGDEKKLGSDRTGDGPPPEPTQVKKASTEPYVKVTTIKLLAQLLFGTEFVDEDLAFSVLSSLLEKATHVDVRLHTTKTLLDMLSNPSSELAQKSIVALESVVPYVGTLNERKPLSEDDWKVAEDTVSPPEYPDLVDGTSPTLAVLLDHYRNSSVGMDRLQLYIDRILLPTMNRLKQQTARWVFLFLKKHGIDNTDLKVPSIPYRVENLISLLKEDNVCYLPRTLLEELVAYVLFNIVPPPSIKALNEKFRDEPSLRSQPDVQTWLSLYGTGIDAIETLNTFDMFSLFNKPSKLSEHMGITTSIIQEQFLKLFTAIIWVDAPIYTALNNTFLTNLLKGTYLIKPWWPTHGKSIVSAMIDYVHSVRTRDWERDANRTPTVLPDTFAWRLLLLDCPLPNEQDDYETKCASFAAQLTTIIDEISGGMYHIKLAQLKSYLALDPVSLTGDRHTTKTVGHITRYYEKRDPGHDQLMRNRLITATYLGDITKTRLSWVTMPEVLRVEVAAFLVGLAEDEDKDEIDVEVRKRVNGRVEEWKGCESEDVRRLGWAVEGKWDT